ncbi:MAG TPA: sugar phosphate isomerase/epimerase family protein [Vicinamibacterales bacterium]|nr:sugar phosphate isomerase/epimerase family protein [Vicinamibacterales bacterium]
MIPRISVFPKCYFDPLVSGEMDYLAWIRSAPALGGEGVEHYDGFFRSLADSDVDPVIAVMAETGQVSSMLCFSPDFTHPEPDEQARQIDRQKAAIDLAVRLGTRYCRTLSGQARPGLSRADGIARTVDGLRRSLDYAEQRDVVLCMENHYKDGTWRYPEFAQPEDIFLEILDRVDSPHLGVQYDPSNAIVGGYDPIRFLDRVLPRVVTMHASDRSLAPGATLDDLRERDGATGYSDKLRHGEIGKGLIDYPAIFTRLARAGFSGWISVEDGVNGLDELARSVTFLKGMRAAHYR